MGLRPMILRKEIFFLPANISSLNSAAHYFYAANLCSISCIILACGQYNHSVMQVYLQLNYWPAASNSLLQITCMPLI